MARAPLSVLTLLTAAAAAVTPPPERPAAAPHARVEAGLVAGTSCGSGVVSWKGVPYAAPPVGELRWAYPEPAPAWEGVRDASAFGPSCVQPFAVHGETSEDCLTANVWAPAPRAGGALRPTAVFIHGGGYFSGGADYVVASGLGSLYDGESLAGQGVCVVTFNYRLGALGWAGHSALGSRTNFGLADQQAALRFVRSNAASFGCDPGNVSLFGESAGAWSTFAHLTAPGSRGLFRRALMESGTALAFGLTSLEAAHGLGSRVEQALGCATAADPLACIRSKDAQAVQDALPPNVSVFFGGNTIFLPVVDGVLVPLDSGAAVADPGIPLNADTVVMGTNRNEGNLFLVTLLGLEKRLSQQEAGALANQTLSRFYGPEQVAHVLDFYDASKFGGDAFVALAELIGDLVMVCGARSSARALAARGGEVSVRLYEFAHMLRVEHLPLVGRLGVFHGSELAWVFDAPRPLPETLFTPAERALSRRMQALWTGFFKTGAMPAEWPAYDAAGDQLLQLDVTEQVRAGFKKEACDFWETVSPA